MIKKIMAALGPEEHDRIALEYACQLTLALNAHLVSTVFTDVPKVEPKDIKTGMPVLPSVPVPIMNAARETYDKYQLEPDIRIVANRTPQRVCARARTADLLVLGVPEAIKTDGLKLVYYRLDSILLKINKPTIVVHEGAKTFSKKILVALEGDVLSDRVLEVVSEIGERAGLPIVCLSIANTEPLAEEVSQRAKEYLEFYPYETEFLLQIGASVAGILETSPKYDCDLIAIRATKRGKLYEIIFNSITESVVKLANHAVLICR